MCPHPPQCQQWIGLPFFPLKGPAALTAGPFDLLGVTGAELDSLLEPVVLEVLFLPLGWAWVALETAFKHLSNLDSNAATLAAMGLESLDLTLCGSGDDIMFAALLQAALPFSAATSAE